MKLKIILIFILIGAIAGASLFLIAPEKLNIDKLFNSQKTAKESELSEKNSSMSKAEILERQLMAQLANLEVTQKNIKRRVLQADSSIEIRASIPRGRPMEWVVWMIQSQIEKTDYQIDDCFYEKDEKGCRMQLSCKFKGNPQVSLVIVRSSAFFSNTAKMAVFIEDFGFQADETSVEYLSFTEPLTIGLVPQKKLAAWTAQIADEYHKEIVLMLPMEPVPPHLTKAAGPVIMVDYTEDKIHSLLSDAMDNIPQFKGIANYYGARVLADSRVMTVLLNKAAEKKVYFLYDRQARVSAIDVAAKELGTAYKSIDMHIDTNSTAEELQDTLRRCAMFAQKTGEVIVSSRPTAAFIKALRDELAILNKNGIRLVYVSDLAANREENSN